MKHRIVALLIALLLCCTFTAHASSYDQSISFTDAERDYIESSGTLTALVNPDDSPYVTFVDGKAVGIIPELIAVIEYNTGLDIDILPVESYSQYIELLNAGNFDLLLDAQVNSAADETAQFVYTYAYLTVAFSKVQLRNTSSQLTRVALLPSNSPTTAHALQYYYEEQASYYNSREECLEAVKSGECTETIMNSYAAERLANSDVRNVYAVSQMSGGTEQVRIALHADADPLLLDILNRAVLSMDSSTRDNIISRYTTYRSPTLSFVDRFYLTPVPYMLALCGAAFVIIVTLALIGTARRRRMERVRAHQFELFISYVCKANDSVYEVNMANGTRTGYSYTEGAIVQRVEPFNSPDFFSTVHPEDLPAVAGQADAEHLRALIADVGQTYFECRLSDGKGGYLWTSCLMQGIKRDPQHPENFMMFMRSIDAAKREEERRRRLLEDAVRAAENANQSKTEFLARMSHEIRTPMNAIVGITEIAKHHVDDPEKTADYLNKVETSSRVLLNIINDVLDMSAISSHKMKIASSEFDLKSVLSGISTLYYTQCKAKGIRFIMATDAPTEMLIGDSLRVNQILLNLVSNAFKFTDRGGEISVLTSQISRRDDTVFIRFIVSDTGCGMDREMLQRLFTPFEQASADTAKKHGGSGLGMSIARNLIEMMNGAISVESAPGKGTKFTVDLPFAFTATKHASHIDKNKLKELTALVIDDEQSSREYTSLLLGRIGVDFDIAASGAQALEMMAQKHYDICFVDWQMPGMDGLTLTRSIRQHYDKDTVVIIVSAFDVSEIEDKAKEAGASMLIAKPLFQSTVFNVLMQMTDGMYTKQTAEPDEYDFSGRHVLLAEDNELNSEIAIELLSMVNMTVDHAENGKIAVEKFTAAAPGTYDIVLMDLQMPVMGGLEAARNIRASDHPDAKAIPIYAMTANAFNEDVTASLSAGMNGHIAKPIDTGVLYSTIAKALDGR